MGLLKLNEVVFDEDIYPRKNVSRKTVDGYADAMKAGAKFPSIEVQRILDAGDEKIIIVDGWHRVEAYRMYNTFPDVEKVIDVEVVFYKDEVLDKQESLTDLRVVSIQRNLLHGDRLSNSDKQSFCQRMADEDKTLKITETMFANIFGVSQPAVNSWIKDIRARQKSTRESLIYKLSFEGWTQQEIADKVGLTDGRINHILTNISSDKIKDEYRGGKSVEDIAEYHGLEPIVVWSIILKDKTDDECFNEFFKEKEKGEQTALQAFNVWTIGKRDPRLGNKHHMNIPGQIVMNLLYYFTEQGDLVVDPMAGGGSTIDACLVMNRGIRAYDLVPVREDVKQRDIYDGFDDRAKKAKLIFFDLPYGDMVVGNLSHEDFYKLVQVSAEKAYETLGEDGVVAYIMCDYTKGEYEPFIPESYNIFKNAGFKCIHRISVPLSTQSANGNEVKLAREKKKLLGRDRVMFIFGK